MKMKRIIAGILLAVLVAALLCGCGKTETGAGAVDLQAFFRDTTDRYELGRVEAAGDELLDAFYPGLRDVNTLQLAVYMPMITGVVSEYAFVQCADKDAAARAAEILQARVDDQAGGGAWYPESMENWAKAKVVTKGNYVAMIAAGDTTESIVSDFENLF